MFSMFTGLNQMLVKSKHPNINMTNDIYVMVEIQILPVESPIGL